LGLAAYRGFVNPVLEPVWEGDELIDLRLGPPQGYAEQMLAYSREWSFLEPES
jgi:dipeptidyl-peptidase-3